MKITVVGAGAMGSMTGGLLKEGGENVCLYSTNKKHIERIRKDGLILEGIGGERAVSIEATDVVEDIGPTDLIIIFVKSYDTEAAAEAAAKIATQETALLTLQNGLGNVEILEKVFGSQMVLAGTSDAAATIVEPGRVRHTANGNIYIGETDGQLTERVEKIVSLFKTTGFKAYASDNVMGLIWTKLIFNLAINPLGAILRAKCRKLIDNEPSRVAMKLIVEEALRVAEAKGVRLLNENMLQAAYDLSEKNADSFCSMAQDIIKGKKTEIDFISGAVVREGKKIGVNTPINQTMTYLVKAIEETQQKEI
jgi:2-dehydropantoate 2-reductase